MERSVYTKAEEFYLMQTKKKVQLKSKDKAIISTPPPFFFFVLPRKPFKQCIYWTIDGGEHLNWENKGYASWVFHLGCGGQQFEVDHLLRIFLVCSYEGVTDNETTSSMKQSCKLKKWKHDEPII